MFRSHFRPRTRGSAATAEGPSTGGLWDGVGPGRWREGARPRTGGREWRQAVLKLADRPRGEAPTSPPSGSPPGRLEPGGGGCAVRSPTAAGRPGRPAGPGRAAAPQVSEVTASSRSGRWEGEGLFPWELLPLPIKPRRLEALSAAVAAPRQLLPAGPGHCRALLRVTGLCPHPASSARESRARTHHRLHTQLNAFCRQFFPLGASWFHDMLT